MVSSPQQGRRRRNKDLKEEMGKGGGKIAGRGPGNTSCLHAEKKGVKTGRREKLLHWEQARGGTEMAC